MYFYKEFLIYPLYLSHVYNSFEMKIVAHKKLQIVRDLKAKYIFIKKIIWYSK